MKGVKKKEDELAAKRNYLLENEELKTLYQYLVASKLITPEDFWSLHHIPIVIIQIERSINFSSF